MLQEQNDTGRRADHQPPHQKIKRKPHHECQIFSLGSHISTHPRSEAKIFATPLHQIFFSPDQSTMHSLVAVIIIKYRILLMLGEIFLTRLPAKFCICCRLPLSMHHSDVSVIWRGLWNRHFSPIEKPRWMKWSIMLPIYLFGACLTRN